ncbi:GTPase IMAP family member 8-like, partial [Mytilus edulis]|uniref:GTPase IMAP family member 8-like n=1 Tax=Mytilus edulis TaxID=6550 RepID=UPI0039EF08A0
MGTTKHIQRESWSYRDKLVTVVDTPAISKPDQLNKIRKEMNKDEINKAVYAIIITIGRFTDEEKEILSSMLAKFSETLKRRTIIVLTRQNELGDFTGDNRSGLEAWLDTTPTIRGWIAKYNFRYFAIENSNQEEHQMIEKEMMESLLDIEPGIQDYNVSGVNSDDTEFQEYQYG